ncbi:hypothetical protein II906_03775 [bacterium]|nr:hypothetical protein [bacterium]
MRINNINSNLNFGKQALMTCFVRSMDTNEKCSATLYKMNQLNADDFYDVMNSKNTIAIKRAMETDFFKRRETSDFYVLQNDKTQEIIGCAEKQNHYKPVDDVDSGMITVINELSGNFNYLNPQEPIFIYLVKNAQDSFRNAITMATGDDIMRNLRGAKFTKNRANDLVLRGRAFDSYLQQAEQRYNVEYIA